MGGSSAYVPPKVWTWDQEKNGGPFAKINRPIAGATHETVLPVGKHPLQLYSLGTPNGVRVTIMLEELLALGHAGAEYDAWLINIMDGDQFGSGFVDIDPNSKIGRTSRHRVFLERRGARGKARPAPSGVLGPREQPHVPVVATAGARLPQPTHVAPALPGVRQPRCARRRSSPIGLYIASRTSEMPWPPPMHIVTRP